MGRTRGSTGSTAPGEHGVTVGGILPTFAADEESDFL